MLTYAMEERGDDPLYEFLYKKIRADILTGNISPGEALPSKRALARHLSVSVITVENAYDQLMTEGYIFSRPRSGFYAADVSGAIPYLNRERTKAVEDEEDRGQPPCFADFSSNQTQPDSFPFALWARLSRKVLSGEKQQLMTNPPTGGVRELREAICGHLMAFRGLDAAWEQVIIGAGTEYLYGLILQLIGLDRTYAVEDPGYRKVSQVCEAHGVKVRRIALDESGLSVDELERSGAQVVHVTPAHHFPTGITMPVQRRFELLRWAAASPGRYIIEDDYDSEFRLSGRPLPALLGMDGAQRVIYMNTFTKTLSSTIRISYMILPAPLLKLFQKKLQFYACTVPTFEQYTLARFIKEGYFEKHINRMRTLSRRKRDLLLGSIQSGPLGAVSSVSEEHAGLHFLLRVRTCITEDVLRARLKERGIRLTRIQGHSAGEYEFIMNYSSVPPERLPEAVQRICEALELNN